MALAMTPGESLPAVMFGIRTIVVVRPLILAGEVYGAAPRFAPYPPMSAFSLYGEPLAAALEDVLSREKPDFLLVDPYLWGGVIAAAGSGDRWATLAHNPMCFRALGVDARGPGLTPPQNWIGRLRERAIAATMHLETVHHLSEVNRVRAQRVLAPLASMNELYTTPPLILATTAEPFEYPRADWPPALHFVGPMIWDEGVSELESGSSADSEVERRRDSRAVILVSDSTVPAEGRAARWAETVIEALADEPYEVVATIPAWQRAGAENVPRPHPRELVSHTAILRHTVCVVCHGGPGIVQKALWFGVPVVAVPFAIDRFEIARRLEVSGAGVILPLQRLTASEIKSAIQRARSCRPAAARVSDAFRAAGGAARAADLIVRFCAHGAP